MEATIGKTTLRAQVTAARHALTSGQRAEGARAIAQHLESLPVWQRARCVGLYAATTDEVATDLICDHALAAGKRVCYPRVLDASLQRLDFFSVDSRAALIPGFRAIPEPPADAQEVAPNDIDALCVPGIAFDQAGHRLGRGSGCYDRWLANYHGVRIGLAFECQLVAQVPTATHDQPVHYIVTEHRMVKGQDYEH